MRSIGKGVFNGDAE